MRILLAEDDRIISQSLVAALRKSGYAVDHVANGADADTHGSSDTYNAYSKHLPMSFNPKPRTLLRVFSFRT